MGGVAKLQKMRYIGSRRWGRSAIENVIPYTEAPFQAF